MTPSPTLDPAEAADLVPDFTPVPITRHRHDGWTPQRQHMFLCHLAIGGVVSRAARAVGMGITSAYGLRRRSGADSFVAAWDTVEAMARDRALAFIIDQATNGTLRPRFYRGRYIGSVHLHETRMALAALRACAAADRAK